MKRYFGLLLPVLITLAGLAVLFCLPAREPQLAQAAFPITPTAVTISGPDTGWVGDSQAFTALVEPITTSLPLTYTWQATGQDLVIHTGGITDTVTFVWQFPGAQLITVTATNDLASVMDTLIFTITAPFYPVYLPILLKERQPGSFMEAVITTEGYELSFPNQYFAYGYVRNLTTEPLYDVFIHFEVTWYCSIDDLGNTGIFDVTPALAATLPGQLNPFAISIFEIKNCYPSIGPIVGISANPWVSGEEYFPLTITGYDYVDSTVSGTVRNDSDKLLQHARVAALLPEPQLGEYQGNRYCGPVEATLDTDTLLPGQENSFTIGYYNCDVDDTLIIVGQGAYQP